MTDINHMPLDIIVKMKLYAKELVRKHPHLKPEKVTRKMAKKFNVKLT